MDVWLSALEPFVQKYGLAGLFANIFLESLGLPVPGETLLILASGLAALGQLNIYAVAATAFCAAVLGDNAGYLIGRKLGRPLLVRYGRIVGITHRRLDRVERVVREKGPIIVLIARFVPLLHQLNGLAAGTVGMRWRPFVLANAAGAALWVGFWTPLVYVLGARLSLLPSLWHDLYWAGSVAVVLIAAALIFGWWYQSRRHRE